MPPFSVAVRPYAVRAADFPVVGGPMSDGSRYYAGFVKSSTRAGVVGSSRADRLTEQQLLAEARRKGVTVSPRQLKRWRLAGLVQKPKRSPRRGVAGSSSSYPPGALDQLVAVATKHAQERRLKRLIVDLWWDGHWVDRDALRRALADAHSKLLHEVEELRHNAPDAVTAAEDLVERITASHHSDPLFSHVRRRLKGDNDALLSVFSTLTHYAFGEEPPWENTYGGPGGEASPRETFEQAIGVTRAQSDQLPGGNPLLPKTLDTPAEMNRLAGARAFDMSGLAELVTEATDDDLDRARDDGRMLEGLGTVASAGEELLGRDFAGFATLKQLAPDGAVSREQLVSMSLVMRRVVPSERFEELRPAVANAAKQVVGVT